MYWWGFAGATTHLLAVKASIFSRQKLQLFQAAQATPVGDVQVWLQTAVQQMQAR
jgi:hypothetical protein